MQPLEIYWRFRDLYPEEPIALASDSAAVLWVFSRTGRELEVVALTFSMTPEGSNKLEEMLSTTHYPLENQVMRARLPGEMNITIIPYTVPEDYVTINDILVTNLDTTITSEIEVRDLFTDQADELASDDPVVLNSLQSSYDQVNDKLQVLNEMALESPELNTESTLP